MVLCLSAVLLRAAGRRSVVEDLTRCRFCLEIPQVQTIGSRHFEP
jgi:hypothetical protein